MRVGKLYVVLILVTIAGCRQGADRLVGRWENKHEVIVLNADGTATDTYQLFKWRLEGGKLVTYNMATTDKTIRQDWQLLDGGNTLRLSGVTDQPETLTRAK